MSARSSWNQRHTGGHRPPLQRYSPSRGGDYGKYDSEFGSCPDGAIDFQRAAVRLHDELAVKQADTEASFLSGLKWPK